MNRLTRLSLTAALALSACVLVPNTADASKGRRVEKIDAEIDNLDARLSLSRGWWNLEVRYEVEVKDARRFFPMQLVLTVLDRDRPLIDHHGRPIVFVVPLDHPTKIDDDEFEFKRRINIRLPGAAGFNPKKLHLAAELFRADDGLLFDHDVVDIDCKTRIRTPVWNDRAPVGRPWPRR